MNTSVPVIWIVDDDASIRWILETALEETGYVIKLFENPEIPIQELKKSPPSVILTDVRMPHMDGITFLEAIHETDPHIPVIVMTAYADLNMAVDIYQKSNVFEYVPKPFEVDEVISLIKRAVRKYQSGKKRTRSRKQPPPPPSEKVRIIGQAPAMQEVFRIIGRVAKTDVTVLINGETGTGKELVARALHALSARAQYPFVALNMAAIPRELMESELFGHEKGAFTGAVEKRIGRFEQADGGTLFLDEIGDMPVELQTRLLRVLNDGTFYRVGGRDPIKVNVRILAATHQDMNKLVREGRFREDLLYRLNVIRIHVPPLRERREDIPLLLQHYLNKSAHDLGLETKTLDPEVEHYLCSLKWPGNVRQLASLCTWLTIMAPGRIVNFDDLPLELRNGVPASHPENECTWTEALAQWAQKALNAGESNIHKKAQKELDRILIRAALHASQYHKQQAAKRLGWGRNTLTRKMKELELL